MPKLNAKTAKAVANQEVGEGGLLPLDAGTYPARLVSVTSKDGKAAPYWSWEYELIDPEPGRFAKQFVNTSLSEKALWKLKEQFEAHGTTPNTDTEELLGDKVNLVVIQRIIQSGQRAGEMGNEVTTTLPYDSADAEGDEEDDGF